MLHIMVAINKWELFKTAFHIACFSVAFSIIGFCIYTFSLDTDLCLVDYKDYYAGNGDVYPAASMCFANPFVESDIDTQSYSEYLSGERFSPKLSEVPYKNVTLDLNSYIAKNWILWRNGTSGTYPFLDGKWRHPYHSYSGYWRAHLLQVFCSGSA